MKNKVEKNKKSKKTRMAAANAAVKKEYKQSQNSNFNVEKNQKINNGIISKIVVTLLIVIMAVIFVFASGAFDVSEIIIEGNSSISDEQIISFSEIQKGTNIFAISNKTVKSKLKENAYINEVQIKRVLPNKIKLIVEERCLEYVLQVGNSYVYIDNQGYILEISNQKPNAINILGASTDLNNVKPNDKLDESDLKRMKNVAKILEIAKKNEMEDLITQVDISNEENYIIYLDAEGKIAHLGNGTDLNTRFLYVKAILKEQQGKNGEIFANVDLNSEYVYFRENI